MKSKTAFSVSPIAAIFGLEFSIMRRALASLLGSNGSEDGDDHEHDEESHSNHDQDDDDAAVEDGEDDEEAREQEAAYRFLIQSLFQRRREPEPVPHEYVVNPDEQHQRNLESFKDTDVFHQLTLHCLSHKIQLASGAADKQSAVAASPICRLLQQQQLTGKVKRSQRAEAAHYRHPTGEHPPALIDNHGSAVFCGQFSSSGDLYMAASQDGHIRLYETDSWTMIRDIPCRDIGWSIISIAYSHDERWIIYSTWSSYVTLFNVYGDQMNDSLLFAPTNHGRFCLFSSQFSPDSTEILGGSSDQGVYVYNLERRELVHRVHAHEDDVNAVAYLDTNTFVSGSDDHLCKVWDRRTLPSSSTRRARPVGVMVGHLSGIAHIDSKNDGRHFISNGKDQTIKLWDVRRMLTAEEAAAARRFNPMQGYDYRAGVGRFDAASRRVSSGGMRHPSDTSLMTYRGHHDLARTLIRARFSPMHTTGQRYIYCGSHQHGCVGYDALTGDCAFNLGGSGARHDRELIRDVSWHPFNNTIATASWNGTCELWCNKDVPDALLDRERRQEYAINGYTARGEGNRSGRRRARYMSDDSTDEGNGDDDETYDSDAMSDDDAADRRQTRRRSLRLRRRNQ